MVNRMCPAPTRCFAMAKAEPGGGHPDADLLVQGARGCVGVAFRPQGRGIAGFDCLGVVLAAASFAGIRLAARRDYSLGACDLDDVLQSLIKQGCRRLEPEKGCNGDMLLATPALGQVHFAILTNQGLVEAHAGLRRVVERPLKPDDVWHSYWRMPVGDY